MKTLLIVLTSVILFIATKLNFQPDPKRKDYFLFWANHGSMKSKKTEEGYLNSLKHFKTWVGGESYPMKKVDDELYEGFKKYLLDNCNEQNTASVIFSKALTIAAVAERRGLIKEPIEVCRIPLVQSPKDFLTNKEIELLSKTYCGNLDLKRAFLFACISGLRISDLREVKYYHLVKRHGKYFLSINMKKTKQPIYNELNKTVRNILFANQDKNEKIFPCFPKSYKTIKKHLDNWLKEAGIDKEITMQNARFTYGNDGQHFCSHEGTWTQEYINYHMVVRSYYV
jgi:hypothetical protein